MSGSTDAVRAAALLRVGSLVSLAVLATAVVVALAELDPARLAPANYPPGLDILSGVALTFLAFLGLAVVTSTGGGLPRATRLALGLTTVLYGLVALVVLGTLAAPAGPAGPVLGDLGAVVTTIAALLAATSALCAAALGAVALAAGPDRPGSRARSRPGSRRRPGLWSRRRSRRRARGGRAG
jgi:hypothetical protein